MKLKTSTIHTSSLVDLDHAFRAAAHAISCRAGQEITWVRDSPNSGHFTVSDPDFSYQSTSPQADKESHLT